MAPAKTAVRSRRTQSYSWSTDSSAMRPGYQSPDPNSRGSGASSPTPVTARRNIHKSGDPAAAIRAPSRSPSRPAFKPKINYDSDSCLTPRSRRTLRRTLSGVTEPWPGVDTISTAPSLDTIYSPTHEILHPMQSLLLEKSLIANANTKPLTTVSFVTVRTTSTGNHFTPTRTTQSVDFDKFRNSDCKRVQPKSSKVESYKLPEPRDEEDAPLQGESTEKHGSEVLAPAPPKNTVVIIMDAEKKPGSKFAALDWAINVAVQPGDEIVILGVLKHVSTPSGYKVVAISDPVNGVKPELLQSEVQRITRGFEQKLSDCGRRVECEKKNVKLTVRIAAGARARAVVVRELAAVKATYAIFDRRVIRGTSYYNKHLSCHAVRMRSNGRSTKTIFTRTTQKINNNGSSNFKNTSNTDDMNSRNPTTTAKAGSLTSASDSPTTSETGSGSSAASSPTHFWRRFTPFRSNRNKWSPGSSSLSPRSSTASSDVASPSPTTTADVGPSLNLDSFMSEMQDFSISLGRADSGLYPHPAAAAAAAAGTKERSMLALQSCVAADAHAYKQGMDSHRVKHRPISVTIPPICAT